MLKVNKYKYDKKCLYIDTLYYQRLLEIKHVYNLSSMSEVIELIFKELDLSNLKKGIRELFKKGGE